MKEKPTIHKTKWRKISFVILLILAGLLLPNKVSFSYYRESGKSALTPNSKPEALNFNTDTTQFTVANEIYAKAGLLFDMTENKVVWVKSLNGKFEIASLTKMMTVLLVIEQIKDGKYDWDSLVKVPKGAPFVGGSSVYLREGEIFTVRDLVKSALIASGNDAAFTLAEYTSGTEKFFVNMMNWKAAVLGMDSTFFSNSTGMPNYGHGKDNYSTPHDLLILANELLKHKEILQYTSESEDFIYHGKEKTVFKNHNSLAVNFKADVDGLKTGFTRGAGFCLVCTANRADHRLISIILGVPSSYTRDVIVKDMLNNYYSSIGLGKLGEPLNKPAEINK